MTIPITYYLVHHPAIRHFKWDPPNTLASSPSFLAATLLAYLLPTLLLSRARVSLPPAALNPIAAAQSLLLTLLSLLMAVATALSIAAAPSSREALFCLPTGTQPAGPLFFWAHVFYLSKLLELVDTLLILLSHPASRARRLTFLHVYHHATVLVMCRVWLSARQSLFPVALVTNSAVHVVMYGYYFLCALGIRPGWKRVVTDCQIVQFVFSFLVSGKMLHMHFVGSGRGGCSGIWGWCFNAGFNASLLALFVDFHAKSYKNKRTSNNNKVKAT